MLATLCLFAVCAEMVDSTASKQAGPSITVSIAANIVVQRGVPFTCTPVRVWDGDGPIWCAEGPRVRLAGIAAREMDGSCRPSHPCPEASAEDARSALVALLGGRRGMTREGHTAVAGPRLDCLSNGGAGGGRTDAWCTLPDGRDLSCALVRSGTVERWGRHDPQGRLTRCR